MDINMLFTDYTSHDGKPYKITLERTQQKYGQRVYHARRNCMKIVYLREKYKQLYKSPYE